MPCVSCSHSLPALSFQVTIHSMLVSTAPVVVIVVSQQLFVQCLAIIVRVRFQYSSEVNAPSSAVSVRLGRSCMCLVHTCTSTCMRVYGCVGVFVMRLLKFPVWQRGQETGSW